LWWVFFLSATRSPDGSLIDKIWKFSKGIDFIFSRVNVTGHFYFVDINTLFEAKNIYMSHYLRSKYSTPSDREKVKGEVV
jgi:hypothetical protein